MPSDEKKITFALWGNFCAPFMDLCLFILKASEF